MTSAEIAAYVAAGAALLNAVAALWFGKQFKEAKAAELDALRGQLAAVGAAKAETIRAKEAQVDAIRQELDALKLFTSATLMEEFRAMKAGLEETVKGLRGQVDAARIEAAAYEARIQQMKIEGETRAGDIQRLTEQKDSIESLAAHLAFKVEELERNPDNLLLPSYYNDISSSSSALTNSLTTAPKYKMPEIPPEFQKLADKASEFTREFDPLLRKMREFGVEFGELKTPEK